MSEDTLMGTNEAYGRVRKMMGQSNTGSIQYPSGTNSRGSSGREHHAEGGAVGEGSSHMKPNFGAPKGGRDTGTRSKAIAQVHGENHKEGDMVGRENHAMGRAVGRMAGRAGNAMQKAAKAAPGAIRQAGNAMAGAARAMPGAMRQAGKAARGAMPPRPMYRRGGRAENMHDED